MLVNDTPRRPFGRETRFMAAVKAAYRNGRLSMMPQPPVVMMRRAA